MSARRNPPSFVLVDRATGLVVYTKRATGVGSEAISKCVKRGRELAYKTGKTYFVFLDIGGLKIGQKVNVPWAYAMGITEEIRPSTPSAVTVREKPKDCPHCGMSYIGTPQMHKFECPPQGGRSLYRENPGRVRRNIFTFNNPPSGPADEAAARELELYIDNDSQLYHSQFIPIVKNLMLKRRKGIYNRDLAVKLFMYLMDSGAKKYVAEFGTRGQKIDSMFNKNTRFLAAKAFRDSFETEAELGNYDRLIGPVSNPLNRHEIAQVINMTKDVARTARNAKALGDASRMKANLAYGRGMLDVSMTFGVRGAKRGVRGMLERYNKIESRESSRSNPGVRKNVFAFNNPLRFKDLGIGEVFVFASQHDPRFLTSGMARGPWVKNGPKTYEHVDDVGKPVTQRRYGGGRIVVGSVNVEVVRDSKSNPRKLNAMEQAAASVGLYVTTWAPGDGKTRYRFHRGPADYHDGSGIYTAVGRADAMKFIQSYGIGRGRKNPLTRAEAGQELKFAREAMMRGADLQRAGKSPTPDFNYAQGIAGVVGRRGTRAAARAAERVMRHVRYNPSPIDPPGLAELDARMNELMRKMDAMKKAKTDGSPEYMMLLKEAQAVSKERIKLIGLGGKVLPNPLLQTVLLANPQPSAAAQKRQMVAFLKREFRHLHSDINSKDAEFDIEGAIYWFANDYHGGGGSALYSILSTSPFKPGPSVRGPEKDTMEQLMYDTLVQKYARSSHKSNPPISAQWDRMTRRQREALLEIVGYDRDYSGGMTLSTWSALSPSAKRKLEAQWLDTTSSGGTTKRRRAPVAVNPLTRTESARILKRARLDLRHGSSFRPGHTKSERSGQAHARAQVVRVYGPQSAGRAAMKIADRAQKMAGTVISNPGVKFPKPGTKMTVAQAMDLARRIGDRELIKQCEAAAKLQSKSNRGSKCVIWKTLPIGSPTRIDMVTAFAHYGDSPEDMYKPPKGSKKGPHMYRHKWGEGTGRQKPVPVLAAPSGKAIIKVMGPGQKVGDWMRG